MLCHATPVGYCLGTIFPLLGGTDHEESQGHDQYQRTLGDAIFSDGTHVNRALRAEGWWWYSKKGLENIVLVALQAAARLAQKGLWADPIPVPQ